MKKLKDYTFIEKMLCSSFTLISVSSFTLILWVYRSNAVLMFTYKIMNIVQVIVGCILALWTFNDWSDENEK